MKDGGTTLENVEWGSSIKPQACAFKFWGEKTNSLLRQSEEESKSVEQSSLPNILDASLTCLSHHRMHLSTWGPPPHSGTRGGMVGGSSPQGHGSEVRPKQTVSHHRPWWSTLGNPGDGGLTPSRV